MSVPAGPHAPRELRLPLRTGLTYHALEWVPAGGAEPRHTVVLVHGFLDFAWGWLEVAPRLAAAGFHVVAPDMRGHGDSDRVGAGGYYHFMDYVADLSEVVRLVARDRLSLVGHSMGGGIVAYWAGVFPDRLERAAILEGIAVPDQPMDGARVAAWINGWTALAGRSPHPGYASLDEAAARLVKNDPRLDPALARRLAALGTRLRPDGRREFKHDPLHGTTGPYGFTFDIAARLWARVTCPVLFIEGAESIMRLPPTEADRRYGCFAHHERVVLPGAAHMLQRHVPVALADELTRFLRG